MVYSAERGESAPQGENEFVKAATILGALLAATLWSWPAPASAATPVHWPQTLSLSVEQEVAPTADADPDDTADGDAEGDTEGDTEGEESSIVDLHATAARLRGRVELGWRVADGAGEGVFVVERSTNGGSWRPVKACSMRFDPDQAEDYGCTDSRLTSGTTYAYRVCIADKGTTCSNATPSEPVTVKAP